MSIRVKSIEINLPICTVRCLGLWYFFLHSKTAVKQGYQMRFQILPLNQKRNILVAFSCYFKCATGQSKRSRRCSLQQFKSDISTCWLC